MGRRWMGWCVLGGLVALVAFAPFRDNDRSGTVLGGPGGTTPVLVDGATGGAPGIGADSSTGTDAGDGGGAGSGGAGTGVGGSTGGGRNAGAGSGGSGGSGGTDGTTGDGEARAIEVPELPRPTPEQLSVLGPLIAAMDTGQRAGTPLLLGIATSIVATGLPADSDVPPELRPVVDALAQLLATPGEQVNDLTTQNSVYLAQLDRALGELAYLNPALNEVIHQTADVLAAMGRSAAPISPPGEVFLTDLSILLSFFVVD